MNCILLFYADKNALAKQSIANELEADKRDTLQDTDEEVEPVAGPSNPMPIVENINEYELNDSDSEADVSIYDDSLPIAENINEYTFDSDGESENDINGSLALLDRNTTNPALTYMLEYSGLSQNQIMHLIKHNKDESHKTASKSTKAAAKNTCIELAEVTKSMDDKSMLTLSEICGEVMKSVESQSMKDTRMAKENMAIELIPSSPESDNSVEVKLLKNNAKNSNVIISDISSSDKGIIFEERFAAKSNDVTQIDTSDSDSNDFIEIQDVPIHDMNISRNIAKKKDIEITFKSDEKLEDDIFADIFEKVNKEEVISTNTEQVQSVDTINGEYRTQLISENSNNLKDSLDTISEEQFEGERKTELPKNTQLSRNMSNDKDEIHDIQNSNKSIERDNTDMHIRVNSFHECTHEKPVLPKNKEDLIELKVNSTYYFYK